MTKKVLLTGGFGTLGGRIADELVKNPEIKLRLASREKQSAPTWAPNSEVFCVDFEKQNSVKQMLEGATHVVHLAALNDYECRADPKKAEHVNVEYTRRIIDQACQLENLRIVYLSTIQVYGDNLTGVTTEISPTNPSDAYSKTHLDAEQIVEKAHQSKKIEGVRLRSANGFGSPMTPSAKIWQIIANDLCRQAIENKRLTLKSHGLQFRNFIPFTDVCTAVKHLLEIPVQQIGDGLFNLGGETPLKIIQMAEIIAARCEAVLGFRPPIDKPSEMPSVTPASFEYSSKKLLSTGLMLDNNIENEIDALLENCKTWFKLQN